MARQIPKIPALPVTKGQLNKVFSFALFINSILAAFGVVMFFLSSWWVFLLLGTLGFPLLAGGFLLYRYTNFKEPMQRYAINFVKKTYDTILHQREGLMTRIYTTVCWFLPTQEWSHLSWGYASQTPKGETIPIDAIMEDKRFYCQLYFYLATGMGNWHTFEDKSILELQSGGGGGLNFISERLTPAKCVGVNTSLKQTEFCEKSYQESPRLRFYTVSSLEDFSKTQGIANQKFDVTLSVQSLNSIQDFKQFLREVSSVMKPGGYFAFTDVRFTEEWKQIEKDLESSPLNVIKKEDISGNVGKALHLNDVQKWQVIYERIGKWVRSILKRVGVVHDSSLAASLSTGKHTAMAYLLTKPHHELVQ